MKSRIHGAFAVTAFLDEGRWHTAANYNLINYCSNELSDDEKILTHWLCYITDRQTAFSRIWNIGGFVFSDLVHAMVKSGDIGLLNSENDASYFIRRGDYVHKKTYGIAGDDEDKFMFVGHSTFSENAQLVREGFFADTTPYFIPRYYPADYKAILSTFVILADYNNSLASYIALFLEDHRGENELVTKLLFSLYLLTYYDIGQPSAKDLDFEVLSKGAGRRRERVMSILGDKNEFAREHKLFRRQKIFHQKRAWCSLRDFFKSPDFHPLFIQALATAGYDNTELLQNSNLLHDFELPGDVWNNNPRFRRCLVENTPYSRRKGSLAKLLRHVYEAEDIQNGYPEQFDTTFDFVPRMCAQDNCDICPYGILNGRATNFHDVCTQNPEKLCPVLLVSCGYRQKCKGKACELLALL